MKYGNLIAKVRAEPSRKNRREGDFGNQHQRAFVLSAGGAHRANINLSFSAAGNAMKQHRSEAIFTHRCRNGIQCARLGGVQC